jgi:hypothetical protein
MKKQTAVEWIEDKIQSDMTFIEILGLIRQAKEMEKQQIINCYNQSWHFRDKPYETAEKYYNETFGGKDEQ